MNIGILSGYWSTNIGNSFFQLGAFWQLNKIFPNSNIYHVPDMHGYCNPASGSHPNSYQPLFDIKLDVLVILGPFLRKEFYAINYPILRYLHSKGVKIIALSAGLMDYSIPRSHVFEMIKSVGISFLSTRDESLYSLLSISDSNSLSLHSGIDSAFYISDAAPAPSLRHDVDPYISLVFDQCLEPRISSSPFSGSIKVELDYDVFYIRNPNFVSENKILNFVLRSLAPRFSKTNSRINNLRIIRADHRFNPYIESKIFSYPGTFSSDVPWGYLYLYANSRAVVSNRVHACAAALSYNVPAMLLSRNKRGGLLERVGATNIRSKITSISNHRLSDIKDLNMTQLKHCIDLVFS